MSHGSEAWFPASSARDAGQQRPGVRHRRRRPKGGAGGAAGGPARTARHDGPSAIGGAVHEMTSHSLAKGCAMRRLKMLGVLIAAGLLAAACGTSSSSSSGKSSGPSGVLTLSNEQGALWTCSFNPFNPSNLSEGVTMGQVYEPLAFVNTLQNAKATPWRATSWAWTKNNTVLTFTIRKGVKFNDGTPMTAADVAFTFNLMKKYPTLDLNSVWSVLSSVTQQGDQVIMTFKNTAVPYFYYIADQTPIVPEHIWSKIANPVTYKDASPVATGAFTVKPCSQQSITYVANKHSWQPGEPKVGKA